MGVVLHKTNFLALVEMKHP